MTKQINKDSIIGAIIVAVLCIASVCSVCFGLAVCSAEEQYTVVYVDINGTVLSEELLSSDTIDITNVKYYSAESYYNNVLVNASEEEYTNWSYAAASTASIYYLYYLNSSKVLDVDSEYPDFTNLAYVYTYNGSTSRYIYCDNLYGSYSVYELMAAECADDNYPWIHITYIHNGLTTEYYKKMKSEINISDAIDIEYEELEEYLGNSTVHEHSVSICYNEVGYEVIGMSLITLDSSISAESDAAVATPTFEHCFFSNSCLSTQTDINSYSPSENVVAVVTYETKTIVEDPEEDTAPEDPVIVPSTEEQEEPVIEVELKGYPKFKAACINNWKEFVSFFSEDIPNFFTKTIPNFFKNTFNSIAAWFRGE